MAIDKEALMKELQRVDAGYVKHLVLRHGEDVAAFQKELSEEYPLFADNKYFYQFQIFFDAFMSYHVLRKLFAELTDFKRGMVEKDLSRIKFINGMLDTHDIYLIESRLKGKLTDIKEAIGKIVASGFDALLADTVDYDIFRFRKDLVKSYPVLDNPAAIILLFYNVVLNLGKELENE